MQRCLGCMREFGDKFDVCPHCGYVVDTPVSNKTHLEPGTLLQQGRYLLGKALGQGGFGITYIAWDNKIGRAVAIKEYLPNTFASRLSGEKVISCYSEEAQRQFMLGLERTRKETHALAQFNALESVVKVFDCIEENGTAYIIMELLRGRTVKEILKERGKLSFAETMHIMTPVLQTLDAMHRNSVIHRDVAPDNIFGCDDGKIKLLDFGAARVVSEEDEKTLSVILKRGFAPPEQYSGTAPQGAFTDVYAASATMYRMLTGETPPDSLSRAKDGSDLAALTQTDAPRYAQETILTGMATDAADRIQSARELLTRMQKKDAPPSKTARIILAAVLAALAIGIAVFWMTRGKQPPVQPADSSSTSAAVTETADSGETTEPESTTEETTEPAQDDSRWIAAYKEYLLDQIKQLEAAGFTDESGKSIEPQFSLIYLDEDNIPELVISDAGFRDARARLVTLYGGKRIVFSDLGFYGSFRYAEKQGIIVEVFDRKATSSTSVSRLKNGKLEGIWIGTESHYHEYLDDGEAEYYLGDSGDIKVSKEEYEEAYAANVPTGLTDAIYYKVTSTPMTQKNVETYFAAVADPGKVTTVRTYNTITMSGTLSEMHEESNGDLYHDFVLDEPIAVQFEEDAFPALLTTVFCHDDAQDALPSGHITIESSIYKDSDGQVWAWA